MIFSKKYKEINIVLKGLLTDSIVNVSGVQSVKDIRVKNTASNDTYNCDIYLYVYYGYKIPDVSWNVQNVSKSITDNIEDIKISKINIYILGVTSKEE